MKELRCMIVDDEPLAVKMIESYVLRTDGLLLEASFSDPVSALDELDITPVYLIFLDIQMPDLDGLQFSKQIPSQTKIIFTTAFKQYAFDSYEVSAVDFLLKPIRYQKFLLAIEKARHWFSMGEKNEIFVRINDSLRRVSFDEISYVRGMKDYVRIKILGEKIPLTTHLTMQAVETLLPKNRFMRVNRSYIVSLDKIDSIDRNLCVYVDGEIIKVTYAYRPIFQKYIKQHSPYIQSKI